jgi:hypothetical protein
MPCHSREPDGQKYSAYSEDFPVGCEPGYSIAEDGRLSRGTANETPLALMQGAA